MVQIFPDLMMKSQRKRKSTLITRYKEWLGGGAAAGRKVRLRLWSLLNWAGRWQLDSALRYAPIVRDMQRAFKTKELAIVEVGSNDYGITPFLKRKIIGIDLLFNKKKIILQKNLLPVIGSAAHLPLRSMSFDVCLCVDVLEHIVEEGRPAILREMCTAVREGGRAYVVSPCGRISQVYDRKLQELLIKKNRENVWLQEHIQYGLPACDELLCMIEHAAAQCQRRINIRMLDNVNRNFWLWYHRLLTVNQTVVTIYMQRLLQPLMPIVSRLNGSNCYRRVYIITFLK